MRQFSNSLTTQKTYDSFVLKVYCSTSDILSLLLVSFSINSCCKVHYDRRSETNYFEREVALLFQQSVSHILRLKCQDKSFILKNTN